ncbi:MAG: polysaccharide deacetylase family protein [Planctomycetota bacterium]
MLKEFDILFGIDMETDIGSFTSFYEGVKKGTPELLKVMKSNKVKGTFYWTGHAAENNPSMVKRVAKAGHETGCHGLYHETLGDPIFPLPNNWPILPDEVEGRLKAATKMVKDASGIKPVSFRCPRLWGSTKVCNVLETLGYVSDASLPLYFYRTMFKPYHPSKKDWTRPGKMKMVQIPNFCDLKMKSNDPKYNRDRDQWPLFRTKGSKFLLKKIDSFIDYVTERKTKPVLAFYFHPWEFYKMPQGAINFGEANVKPVPFITKNCGKYALKQLDILIKELKQRGGIFKTAQEIANDWK